MSSQRVYSGAARSSANSRMSEASSGGAAHEGGSAQSTAGGSSLDQDTGQDDLIRMQEIFEEADEDGGGGLDIDEFKVAMKKVLGEATDDRELEKIFMKVDTNCDGTVDWDEFLSYLLLEYLEKDLIKAMMAETPFSNDEVELPRKHSALVTKMRFYPLTRSVTFTHCAPIPGRGRYFTLDESGVVNVWSHDMRHIRKMRCPSRGYVPLCCRDLAVLSNLNLIVVASTLNELWFFDINKFERQFTVTKLPHSAECLFYHYDYRNTNHSILFWGDTGGSVFIVQLYESQMTGFATEAFLNSKKEMGMDVYFSGKFPHCKSFQHVNIHASWTRQIMYLPSSKQFISCSWSSKKSMVVSLLRENGRPPYVFNVTKGITCFDYSEELNVVITAGVDQRVKIWDPYMPSQPLNILVGHNARVEYLSIDHPTNTIIRYIVTYPSNDVISFSADNYVKVWDIPETKVTQSFNANYPHLQPHDVSAVLFAPQDGKLLLATKEIVYRERTGNLSAKKDAKKMEDPKSHGKGVTCVLYNPVFEVVVSADQYSTVCVWDYKTGKKLMQFSGCHTWNINGRIINLEITAISFDPTYRRLFTGSKDGIIKVWNFNNGNCLDEYETCEENEIGGMVYGRNRIFTGGWSKNIYCIFDAKDDDDKDTKCWEQKHVDDIQCIDKVGSFIVSADYDGDIIFWHSDTGRFAFRYNVNESAHSMQAPQPLEFSEKVSDVIGGGTKSRSDSRKSSRMSFLAGRRSKLSSSRENIYNRSHTSGYSQQSSGRKFHSASKRVVEPLDEKYCSVVSMTTMASRVLEPKTATLWTGTSFGWVYAWAASVGTKMLGQFFAGSAARVPINAMATNPDNQLLFSGDSRGYIRVWSIFKIAIGEKEKQRSRDVTEYPFKFPFAQYMKKISRQLQTEEPLEIFAEIPKLNVTLLASFQGHLAPVTTIDMIPECHLIVSGASNGTVKLFTVAGKCVGTFGQPQSWRSINYYLSENSRGIVPPVLKRSCSPMSTLIMRGKKMNHWNTIKTLLQSSTVAGGASHFMRQPAPKTKEDESSDSDVEVRVATMDDETVNEIMQEDFSFDIRSDVMGVAYKNRDRSNKHKYMGDMKNREAMVESTDVYHNLNVTNEIPKLPELPKPTLLKEVIAKQASIQNDVMKIRQRGLMKAVKVYGSSASFNRKTKFGLKNSSSNEGEIMSRSNLSSAQSVAFSAVSETAGTLDTITNSDDF